MTDENEPVESEVLDFSKIYPTEIKYQNSNGFIQSVHVKEADITFKCDVDEDGTIIGNRLLIVLEVADVTKDVVIQDYAREIRFEAGS